MSNRQVQNLQFSELPSNGVNTITLKSNDSLLSDYILTLPASTGEVLTNTSSATLSNKTIVDSTNTVSANSLNTTTGIVNMSSNPPPISGQTIIATNSTNALWTVPGNNTLRKSSILSVGDNIVGYGISDPIDRSIITSIVTTNASSNYAITRAVEWWCNSANSTRGFFTFPSWSGIAIGPGGTTGGFMFRAKFGMSDLTVNSTFFCGLKFTQTITPFASLTNLIGIGFDVEDGTGTYKIIYGGSVSSTIDTGIIIGNGTKYVDFSMYIQPGSNVFNYSVTDCNTLAVFSGSLNLVLGVSLPPASMMLALNCLIRTSINTDIRFRFCNMYLETQN